MSMGTKNYPKRLDSKTSCLRITVPDNLDLALEGLIRKVLKEQPKTDDIYAFAADYFETLLRIRDKAGPKFSTTQLCPFHNDEDAHEMIKMAGNFPKPTKHKTENLKPKKPEKKVAKEPKIKSTKSENAKKQATPDLIRKLPKNEKNSQRPFSWDKKSDNGENDDEEFIKSDPIKELVEKELLESKANIKKPEKNAQERPTDNIKALGEIISQSLSKKNNKSDSIKENKIQPVASNTREVKTKEDSHLEQLPKTGNHGNEGDTENKETVRLTESQKPEESEEQHIEKLERNEVHTLDSVENKDKKESKTKENLNEEQTLKDNTFVETTIKNEDVRDINDTEKLGGETNHENLTEEFQNGVKRNENEIEQLNEINKEEQGVQAEAQDEKNAPEEEILKESEPKLKQELTDTELSKSLENKIDDPTSNELKEPEDLKSSKLTPVEETDVDQKVNKNESKEETKDIINNLENADKSALTEPEISNKEIPESNNLNENSEQVPAISQSISENLSKENTDEPLGNHLESPVTRQEITELDTPSNSLESFPKIESSVNEPVTSVEEKATVPKTEMPNELPTEETIEEKEIKLQPLSSNTPENAEEELSIEENLESKLGTIAEEGNEETKEELDNELQKTENSESEQIKDEEAEDKKQKSTDIKTPSVELQDETVNQKEKPKDEEANATIDNSLEKSDNIQTKEVESEKPDEEQIKTINSEKPQVKDEDSAIENGNTEIVSKETDTLIDHKEESENQNLSVTSEKEIDTNNTDNILKSNNVETEVLLNDGSSKSSENDIETKVEENILEKTQEDHEKTKEHKKEESNDTKENLVDGKSSDLIDEMSKVITEDVTKPEKVDESKVESEESKTDLKDNQELGNDRHKDTEKPETKEPVEEELCTVVDVQKNSNVDKNNLTNSSDSTDETEEKDDRKNDELNNENETHTKDSEKAEELPVNPESLESKDVVAEELCTAVDSQNIHKNEENSNILSAEDLKAKDENPPEEPRSEDNENIQKDKPEPRSGVEVDSDKNITNDKKEEARPLENDKITPDQNISDDNKNSQDDLIETSDNVPHENLIKDDSETSEINAEELCTVVDIDHIPKSVNSIQEEVNKPFEEENKEKEEITGKEENIGKEEIKDKEENKVREENKEIDESKEKEDKEDKEKEENKVREENKEIDASKEKEDKENKEIKDKEENKVREENKEIDESKEKEEIKEKEENIGEEEIKDKEENKIREENKEIDESKEKEENIEKEEIKDKEENIVKEEAKEIEENKEKEETKETEENNPPSVPKIPDIVTDEGVVGEANTAPGEAQTPEIQIKTIQTHYYDTLQVPETITKELRVHSVGAQPLNGLIGATDLLHQGYESVKSLPTVEQFEEVIDENMNVASLPANPEDEKDTNTELDSENSKITPLTKLDQADTETQKSESDILQDLMTPSSDYSINLSELSFQTVSGMFLDGERRFSSFEKEEVRYVTPKSADSAKDEPLQEVQEIIQKTVIPSNIEAVPLEPRSVEEILQEENIQNSENVKDKKDVEKPEKDSSGSSFDSSNGKSADSDAPIMSVEVRTVIETQLLDENDDDTDLRPEVEVNVVATIDVEEPDSTEEEKTREISPSKEQQDDTLEKSPDLNTNDLNSTNTNLGPTDIRSIEVEENTKKATDKQEKHNEISKTEIHEHFGEKITVNEDDESVFDLEEKAQLKKSTNLEKEAGDSTIPENLSDISQKESDSILINNEKAEKSTMSDITTSDDAENFTEKQTSEPQSEYVGENSLNPEKEVRDVIEKTKEDTENECQSTIDSKPKSSSSEQRDKTGSSGESDSVSSTVTQIKRAEFAKRTTSSDKSLLSTQSLDSAKRSPLLKTRSLSSFRHGVTDFEVWNTIEKELEEAATKIQSKFRGYKTRKKLQRENAVQIPTDESSVSTTPIEGDPEPEVEDRAERQQSTGEFHDSIVLSEHPR